MNALIFLCFAVLATLPAVMYGVNNGATVLFILLCAVSAFKVLRGTK